MGMQDVDFQLMYDPEKTKKGKADVDKVNKHCCERSTWYQCCKTHQDRTTQRCPTSDIPIMIWNCD